MTLSMFVRVRAANASIRLASTRCTTMNTTESAAHTPMALSHSRSGAPAIIVCPSSLSCNPRSMLLHGLVRAFTYSKNIKDPFPVRNRDFLLRLMVLLFQQDFPNPAAYGTGQRLSARTRATRRPHRLQGQMDQPRQEQ